MIIGVLCDSHDNMDAVKKAVKVFVKKKVDLIIHAGDIVAPFALDPFMDLEIPIIGVFGNNDGEKVGINKKMEPKEMVFKEFIETECDGKKVAIYHGTQPRLLEAIVKSKTYDIVICGHTHQPEITLDENTVIVNPGETCGYLTGVMSIAIIDTETMDAQIHELS